MTDGLERICSISDLSVADRERLQAELQFIAGVLRQIDRGAGFCEDRGFSWTAEQERAEGSLRLFDSLRAWPILRRLLPRLRHYRHQQDPVIGAGTVPIDDVEAAMLLVGGNWSSSGKRAAVLAERMNGATIPCDRCGRTVQSFAIVGAVLTIRRPGPEPDQAAEIGPGALLPLRKALAAQDLTAIRAIDPSWVEGYCPERDASYCRDHLAHA